MALSGNELANFLKSAPRPRSHGVLLNMLFGPQAELLPRSIQWNDASSHWMPAYFWGSMAANRLGASLSRLDRFISWASRADPSFANRYGFAHNPTIGGHPAFSVRDVQAVRARLEMDGNLVSDAKIYAMDRTYQIYFQDPSANMIEVNQFV